MTLFLSLDPDFFRVCNQFGQANSMTTATYIQDDFDRIERSGSIAVQIIQLAWKIRSFLSALGSVAFAYLVLVLLAPFLALIFGLLRFFVWRLEHSKPFSGTLNAASYKTFRLRYEKLCALSKDLQPIASIDLSKKNWLARIFIAQVVKTASIFQRHESEMAAVLHTLDQPFGPLPAGWKVFATDERWASRPKPYEYIA